MFFRYNIKKISRTGFPKRVGIRGIIQPTFNCPETRKGFGAVCLRREIKKEEKNYICKSIILKWVVATVRKLF